MTQKYYLTDHAITRLGERSTLTSDELLSLADCCAVLVYIAGQNIHYRMIWSSKDRNGYILVTDMECGAIITIKTVLGDYGHPCLMHDAARKPSPGYEVGVAKVTSQMVEQAVTASGADLSEAKYIINALKKREASEMRPRAWLYRWKLTYLHTSPCGKMATKSTTIGRESDVRAPDKSIIDEAVAIVSAAAGWNATLSLVGRDDMKEVAEYNLDDVLAARSCSV